MKQTRFAHAMVAALLSACSLVGVGIIAHPAAADGGRTIALGMDVLKSHGGSTQDAVTRAEATIGHKFAFTRDFLLWDSPFPTSYENWLGARGTTPVISVKARLANGTGVKWADIAAAKPGSALYSQMVSWADRMRDFGYPVYFTLNHEPEAKTNLDLGSATDFIAAWQRMHDLFAAEGATNTKFMWIMTSWAFQVPPSDRRYGVYWYPGDTYVDGIAADAYNWSTCRDPKGAWETLAQSISGFVAFGRAHPRIPLVLTEFATVERADGDKPNWLAQAQALLKQPAYSQIVGVSYFDQLQYGVSCGWPINSSVSSTAAMSAMAQDDFYQGSLGAEPTPPPPPPPPAAPSISFVGSASTTANSPAETVRVPGGVTVGDTLVLIGTSGTARALNAPPGWTAVATTSSPSMYSAVWQRVASSADPGAPVTVDFGGLTKGSLEILAYTGSDARAAVQSATSGGLDTAFSTLATPALIGSAPGRVVLSYWAVRTSVDTTVTPGSDETVRASEAGTGGGRIVSVTGESDGGTATGRVAVVAPATGHGITWTLVLSGSN